jgi:hypothetical protein
VLLAGEPGICKTQLADELTGHAEPLGARVLRGDCWEGGDAPAHWPSIQILGCCSASLQGTRVRDGSAARCALERRRPPDSCPSSWRGSWIVHGLTGMALRSSDRDRFRLFGSVVAAGLCKRDARGELTVPLWVGGQGILRR